MEPAVCQGCLAYEARVADLERRVKELEVRNRQLEEFIRSNQKTEPPPPPAVPPRGAPDFSRPQPKSPTGKKPGAQPKHPPRLKQLLPAERVSKFVPYIPEKCDKCEAKLSAEPGPNDPPPSRHQVAELPVIRAEITEYQGHFRTCSCCGAVNHAAIPANIKAESVGPKLAAVMSYLVGVHHVSKRGVEEIVEDVFETPISLGKVSALEQEMSQALLPAHEKAIQAIREAPVKNLDETGWKQAGVKRWLWAAATANVVAFLIHSRRNLSALTMILGSTIIGIIHSDRWKVYDNIPIAQRQLCWAHLRRNFEKVLERGAPAKALAEGFILIHDEMFRLWHLYRGGGLSRPQLAAKLDPLARELGELLRLGKDLADEKTSRLCATLLKLEPALWTFVLHEGVQPTNNHCERVQRLAVLWRKCCFGCHSAEGCRFAERLLTAVQTLRLQKRSVLAFLTQAIQAHRAGQKPPSLVKPG